MPIQQVPASEAMALAPRPQAATTTDATSEVLCQFGWESGHPVGIQVGLSASYNGLQCCWDANLCYFTHHKTHYIYFPVKTIDYKLRQCYDHSRPLFFIYSLWTQLFYFWMWKMDSTQYIFVIYISDTLPTQSAVTPTSRSRPTSQAVILLHERRRPDGLRLTTVTVQYIMNRKL